MPRGAPLRKTTAERSSSSLPASPGVSGPDHPGLLLGAETQFFVETGAPRAQPKELDPLQSRMIQDSSNDFRADSLFLISLIDDYVPDRRSINKIRQDTAESDQAFAVPRADGEIGVTKHLLRFFDRPILGPGSLMEETEQLIRLGRGIVRIENGGLEGGSHLILDYPPRT